MSDASKSEASKSEASVSGPVSLSAGAPRWLAVLALVLGAIDLAPSLAHALEAPPRLWVWTLDLWREATVFNGQFALFGWIGAPLELATILVVAACAFLSRRSPGGTLLAWSAFAFVAALAAWIGLVAPANAVLATWTPGPLPGDAAGVRLHWELGHLACAALKLTAFVLLTMALAGRPPAGRPGIRRV